MANQKQKHAKCPCCLTEKHRTELSVCLTILEKIERKEIKHYKELKIDTYNSFIAANFEWACDNCLSDKKATLAKPGLQAYASTPHLAYHDKNMTCRACGTEFKFTKEEKQLWYEKLKFWVDSEPSNCLKCRRQKRLLKSENKVLSDILRKGADDISTDEYMIVADIYRKWDKVEKAKFYDSIVKRKL
jgi:hypothetical protein